MKIGGWIAALWAVVAWSMLIGAEPLAQFTAICVLIQAILQLQTLARHAALFASTLVFGGAIGAAALMFGTPLPTAISSVARLLAVVVVAPVAGEYATGFWLCRLLARLPLGRLPALTVSSSLSVMPSTIENVLTLLYHHKQLRGRRAVGVAAINATIVIALDGVQEMEVADAAFDVSAIFGRAPNHRMRPSELVYLAQLTALAFGASRMFLS